MQPKRPALRTRMSTQLQVLDEVDYLLLCKMTGLPREAFPPKSDKDESLDRLLLALQASDL